MTDDRSLLDRTESLIEEKIDGLSQLEYRISEIEREKENQREAQKEIENSKIELKDSIRKTQSR